MTTDSLMPKTAETGIAPRPSPAARPDNSIRVTASATPRDAQLPPAILLGGETNALSVARDLARGLGVRVYLLLEDPGTPIRWSRHAQTINVAEPRMHGGKRELANAWASFLLGPQSDHLRGAVLLTCSDTGIQVLSHHRDRLLEKFRLDIAQPDAQLKLLDKLSTYQLASAAGIPTPRFWEAATREQVRALESQLVFPLLVKPRLSHVFQAKFGRKFLIATNFQELLSNFDVASSAELDVLLMEWIPGPDSAICSYFTYLDERGEALFHFTKRVVRRYPVGMGTGCHHMTDWIPELVPLGLKLFDQAGVRGLANVEFKLDPRDGKYKVIECNARFNGSNSLITACGFDLSRFVYDRVTGRTAQTLQTYRVGLHLIDPLRDFCAFCQLRAAGEITLKDWVTSLLHRQTFPYFAMTDPLPAVARALRPVKRLVQVLTHMNRGG